MATFTWTAGTTDPWSTLADWSPLPAIVPGTVAANRDVVNFLESTTGNKSVYTVTINSADTFDIATLNIGNATATHHQPALSISGHLLTDNLSYTAGVANGVTITINAGGLFDIRSSITNESGSAETVTIVGTGTGGHLEFGSATQSGIGVNQANVTFNFSNGDGENAGVIEYLSGFNPAGTTTSQTITNLALGDGIIFDGANFTGDTFVYASATKTLAVKNSGKTVLTMNHPSGSHLTSSSFVARGNEIVVAPVGSFTWATATSGSWNTAADWSPNNGLYPGSADNNPGDTALINVTGPAYTVTYGVPSNTIGALTVNSASTTLAFNQPVAAALTITGVTALTAGTISVASASASLSIGTFAQTGGTFTETAGTVNVTGAASLTTGNSDTILGGKFNAGTLTVGNNLSFLAGTITSGAGGVTISSGQTVTISAPADLNATTGGLNDGGTIIGSGTIDGAISGSGTLKASGGTLDLTGTFGSGPAAAIDATTTSELKFDNTATIATLTNITSATQTLEVGSKGTVTLTGSGGFVVSGGQIVMSGGALTDARGITVGNGTIAGTLIGSGSVNAAIGSFGSGNVVEASGGLLAMNGAVAGSGLIYAIANSKSSVLEITPGPDPTTTGNFDFLGGAGELQFNGAINPRENITGLNVGASATNPTNFVDLLGRSLTVTSGFTGAGDGGTVTLSDGTILTLSGVTNGNGTWFVDALSVNGGTEVFLSSVVCYAPRHTSRQRASPWRPNPSRPRPAELLA
jgi:large repetitive protein